jgi:hypothetical protein
LKGYTDKQLANLSFLVGGVGDGASIPNIIPISTETVHTLLGRHAFATLVGLHHIVTPNPRPKALQSHSLGLLHDFQLTPEQKSTVNIHMTLLDIHPGIIARDIIFFMLFDQLVDLDVKIESAERKKERGKEKASGNDTDALEQLELEKLEVVTTVFYLYSGYMLPSYCYERSVCAICLY